MFALMGRLRSTALYGIAALLACLLWLNVEPATIRGTDPGNSGVLGAFYSLVSLSPVAYPLLMAIHVVMCKIDDRIRGNQGSSTWTEDVLGAFVEDVRSPFLDVWIPIFRAKANDTNGLVFVFQWTVAIACLIWAVILLGFLTYGLANAN